LRICFFDAFSGISGDMALAALLDCGIALPNLKKELKSLRLTDYSITRRKVVRHGIRAARVNVAVHEPERVRSLAEILDAIGRSGIQDWVRRKAIAVFHNLAKSEARVHGEKVGEVHLHEVGATDAIIDVVGVLTLLRMLGVDDVYSTALPLGQGFVETRHGLMPIPAPATIELLRDYPVTRTGRRQELTTPTGAALISTLSSGVGLPSPFCIERVGYGAGTVDSEAFPNLLRVLIGEVDIRRSDDYVYVVETNIDDMDPQLVPHLQEEVMKAGAVEAFRSHVQMKKNRPGILLRALVPRESFDRVTSVIFEESTTIGLRFWGASRLTLPRTIRTVETSLGKIRVKEVVLPSGERRLKPEHEDCMRIAREKGLSLMEVVMRVRGEVALS
jgi:hypothetical protein